jgi:succinate-acetate transporter protein
METPSRDPSVGVFLRPVGNPVPLGFFGLAAGTMTLAAMQLGWIPAGESKDVALVMLGFVFPLQLVATIFAILARDGAAAEGVGLVAGGWFVVGLVMLTSIPGSTSNTLGIFLLTVGLLLLGPALASASTKTAAAAVFLGAGIRFALTGVYELTASGTWEDIAGIAGLVLFVVAFYAGLSLTLADSCHGAGPLPLGRAEGGYPIGSDPAEQISREPGVRPLL